MRTAGSGARRYLTARAGVSPPLPPAVPAVGVLPLAGVRGGRPRPARVVPVPAVVAGRPDARSPDTGGRRRGRRARACPCTAARPALRAAVPGRPGHAPRRGDLDLDGAPCRCAPRGTRTCLRTVGLHGHYRHDAAIPVPRPTGPVRPGRTATMPAWENRSPASCPACSRWRWSWRSRHRGWRPGPAGTRRRGTAETTCSTSTSRPRRARRRGRLRGRRTVNRSRWRWPAPSGASASRAAPRRS